MCKAGRDEPPKVDCGEKPHKEKTYMLTQYRKSPGQDLPAAAHHAFQIFICENFWECMIFLPLHNSALRFSVTIKSTKVCCDVTKSENICEVLRLFQVWKANRWSRNEKQSFLHGELDRQAHYLGGNALFLLFYHKRSWDWGGGPWRLAQITLWRMLGAAEHTVLKEPFFSTPEKVVHQLRPCSCSQKKKTTLLLQTPCSFLPASPGCRPSASCGWTGAGWPPAPNLRGHLFSSGIKGVLVLAGWSRELKGFGPSFFCFFLFPKSEGLWGLKELEHFHMPSFVEHLHTPAERKDSFIFPTH